jgi:hypothetical protein
MIEIGDLRVESRWHEFAVRLPDGTVLECDTLDEARDIADPWSGDITILHRYVYVTEYTDLESA